MQAWRNGFTSLGWRELICTGADDDDVRTNYDDFAYCVSLHPPEHLIDSSTLSVDQVAQRIQGVLDERWSPG